MFEEEVTRDNLARCAGDVKRRGNHRNPQERSGRQVERLCDCWRTKGEALFHWLRLRVDLDADARDRKRESGEIHREAWIGQCIGIRAIWNCIHAQAGSHTELIHEDRAVSVQNLNIRLRCAGCADVERESADADAQNFLVVRISCDAVAPPGLDLLKRECAAELLTGDVEFRVLRFDPEEGADFRNHERRAGAEVLVHRAFDGFHFDEEGRVERDARNIYRNRRVQASGDALLRCSSGAFGEDEEIAAAVRHGDEVGGAVTDSKTDIGERYADDFLRSRAGAARDLLECEVAAERETEQSEIQILAFHTNVFSSGQLNRRGHTTNKEVLGDCAGECVDLELERAAERDAGDIQRDGAAECAYDAARIAHTDRQ